MTVPYPNRMPPAPPRVFVSSTYFDLKSVRQELTEFLENLGFQPVLFEIAGAIPNIPAADSALQHAAQADLCILIVGARYGSVSEKILVSYTHSEFRTALDMGTPIFIFIERETLIKFELYRTRASTDFWTDEERQIFAFIDELSQRGSRFPFDTLPELKKAIRYQLASYFGYLIREFASLDSLSPGSADGWNTFGNILWNKRGQYGGAIFCYRKVLELEETNRFGLENLARSLRITGRPREALPLCKKGIELYPEFAVYRRELALTLLELGEKDEAVKEIELAVAAFPNDDRVFVTLSWIYWTLGRKKDAAIAAKRACDIQPHNAEAYNKYMDYRQYLDEE